MHLLLIDDDPGVIPAQVCAAFPPPRHRVDVAGSGSEGLACLRASPPDVVLLDLRLPDQSGLEVLERIKNIDARIPVIFITMAKSADSAIEAMKRGAFDYLCKPLHVENLRRVVGDAAELARLRAPVVLAQDGAEVENEGALCGTCPAMLDVYKAIGRVAAQDVTVLITGESGTGKELVARAIFQHSTRATGPFLALNCAAIPEQLLESELFGHERGAFTGADRRRIGKFEQCRGGTLLLDEIGDMPMGLQAKILRVLQEQTFERVGGSETLKADVRIIASTHRDLRERATNDRFRADLYYRLSVFTIQLPSLRERGNDLPMLAHHYLRRFNKELGRSVVTITSDAMELLASYDWPGNVRELQSALKIALLQASGSSLLPSFLPPLGEAQRKRVSLSGSALDLEAMIDARLSTGAVDLYAETHGLIDRILLARVVEFTRGNHRDAAQLLGISRQTLRVKMRALGLTVAHSVEAEDGPLAE
jgi:DNA-binding NtrC family response regulator